jgi:hypothetical protein
MNSSRAITVSPLRPTIVTGVISASKRPDARAPQRVQQFPHAQARRERCSLARPVRLGHQPDHRRERHDPDDAADVRRQRQARRRQQAGQQRPDDHPEPVAAHHQRHAQGLLPPVAAQLGPSRLAHDDVARGEAGREPREEQHRQVLSEAEHEERLCGEQARPHQHRLASPPVGHRAEDRRPEQRGGGVRGEQDPDPGRRHAEPVLYLRQERQQQAIAHEVDELDERERQQGPVPHARPLSRDRHR